MGIGKKTKELISRLKDRSELHREHYSAIVSINYLLAYVYPTTDPSPRKKMGVVG